MALLLLQRLRPDSLDGSAAAAETKAKCKILK